MTNNNEKDNYISDSNFSIVDFYRVIFKYKNTVIIFFSVIFVVTLFVAITSTDIYQSDAKIMIKTGRENTLLDPTAAIGEVTTVRRDIENEINSELQILQSRDLANMAVNSLGVEYFEGKESLESNIITTIKEYIGKIFVNEETGGAGEPLALETETLIKKELLTNKILSNFHCEGVSDSNIINLKYEDENPEKSQDILKALVNHYLEIHMSVHRTEGTYDFFTKQTKTLEKDLEQTGNELKELKNRTGISSLEKQRSLLLERIESLKESKSEAKSSAAESERKISALSETLKDVPKTLVQAQVTGSPSSAVEELRKKVYLLKLEEQELLSTYSEESVPITEIRRQLKSAEALLSTAEGSQMTTSGLNSAYQQIEMNIMMEKANLSALNEKSKEIETQLGVAIDELNALHNYEQQITSLTRNYEIDEVNLKKYSEGKEQARIDNALENGNISNVSIAQECSLPINPVRPDKKMIVVMGFFIGAFGALGLAFFREYLDHTLTTPNDISDKLGMHILGAIPIAKKSKQFIKIETQMDGQFCLPDDGVKFLTNENDNKDSVEDVEKETTEGSETLDITISNRKNDLNTLVHSGKIIAITSSRAGEGVSTFSTYFASMLKNHMDKKVVLVDTNFEKPSVHKILGGRLSPGLGEVLTKKNELKILQNNSIHGIDFIAAGQKATNNVGPYRKKIITELLQDLRRQYDYIVLDTTPLWNGNNSKKNGWEILSDGVILVVEAERIRWEVAKSSKEKLEKMNANIIGAILNKRKFHIPEWLYKKL